MTTAAFAETSGKSSFFHVAKLRKPIQHTENLPRNSREVEKTAVKRAEKGGKLNVAFI
jgi:hypothetical protein